MIEKYINLVRNLFEKRCSGKTNEEDKCLEEMDDCWWEMTPEDRAQVESCIETKDISTPKDLNMIDVEVHIGDNKMPRKVANERST